jgi:glycosyltransferase involved in cell wall biosynthesis
MIFSLLKRLSRRIPKKIVAIIAVRNGEPYIKRCIDHLIANELEVAVLDNESTDNTNRIISDNSHKLIFHGTIPFDGYYRVVKILQAKDDLARQLKADWMVHVDADEILHSCRSGETLRTGIERAARTGASVVNFDEFVFIPRSEQEDYRDSDYPKEMKWYYFFEPHHHRLMRAFSSRHSNIEGAGHRVGGKPALYEQNFALCHYIALSLQMLKDKYESQIFPEDALARGWHKSRANIDLNHIALPASEKLKYWLDNRVESLDKSNPEDKHFWGWN